MEPIATLIAKLSSRDADFVAIANELLALDLDFDAKTNKALRQHAQEIVHYANQLANADSAQWQQSFQFELLQSVGALKKALKKIK